jgi:hypothetical protein
VIQQSSDVQMVCALIDSGCVMEMMTAEIRLMNHETVVGLTNCFYTNVCINL